MWVVLKESIVFSGPSNVGSCLAQNSQPLCFGRSLLCPRALHYDHITMPPDPPPLPVPKNNNKNCLFSTTCVHQMCQQLVAHVPFLWCWLCLTSWWDDFCFQSFQIVLPKLKASSQVVNLVKKRHTKISGKNIHTEKFPCIVQSMQSIRHVKSSVCFLGLFCRPLQNVWCQMTYQLKVLHQQSKSNGKYAEDFPFYGLWDTVFAAFGCNLSRDAFHKILCSAQHHSLCNQSCFWEIE